MKLKFLSEDEDYSWVTDSPRYQEFYKSLQKPIDLDKLDFKGHTDVLNKLKSWQDNPDGWGTSNEYNYFIKAINGNDPRFSKNEIPILKHIFGNFLHKNPELAQKYFATNHNDLNLNYFDKLHAAEANPYSLDPNLGWVPLRDRVPVDLYKEKIPDIIPVKGASPERNKEIQQLAKPGWFGGDESIARNLINVLDKNSLNGKPLNDQERHAINSYLYRLYEKSPEEVETAYRESGSTNSDIANIFSLADSRKESAKANEQYSSLNDKYENAQSRLADQEAELEKSKEELAKLQASNTANNEQKNKQIVALQTQIAALNQNVEKNQRIADAYKSQAKTFESESNEYKARIDKLREANLELYKKNSYNYAQNGESAIPEYLKSNDKFYEYVTAKGGNVAPNINDLDVSWSELGKAWDNGKTLDYVTNILGQTYRTNPGTVITAGIVGTILLSAGAYKLYNKWKEYRMRKKQQLNANGGDI